MALKSLMASSNSKSVLTSFLAGSRSGSSVSQFCKSKFESNVGRVSFLIPVGFGFHKIDYKRFQYSLLNFFKKLIHQVRVSIFIFLKNLFS
jgi:hypothetical protein